MFSRAAAEQEFERIKHETRVFELYCNAPDSPGIVSSPNDVIEVSTSFDSFLQSLESPLTERQSLALGLLADISRWEAENKVLGFVLPQLMCIIRSREKQALLRFYALTLLISHHQLLTGRELRVTILSLCELALDEVIDLNTRCYCYFLVCKHENPFGSRRYNQGSDCFSGRNHGQIDVEYVKQVQRRYGDA